MESLYNWFSNFWESLSNFVQDIFYWIVNTIISIIGTGISWASSFLPTYSIPVPDISNSVFLQTLNWLFPVSYSIQLFGGYIVAMITFLIAGTVLRWFKVVR